MVNLNYIIEMSPNSIEQVCQKPARCINPKNDIYFIEFIRDAESEIVEQEALDITSLATIKRGGVDGNFWSKSP